MNENGTFLAAGTWHQARSPIFDALIRDLMVLWRSASKAYLRALALLARADRTLSPSITGPIARKV
jgi:hypothetical protein